MRRTSSNRQRYGEPIQFLMTPLIDVTVLVISFFILAGTFASLDAIQLTVPTVHGNRPVEVMRQGDKLVINVPPLARISGAAGQPSEARSYVVSGEMIRPGDTARLVERLKLERKVLSDGRAGAAGVQVEVRADKSVEFTEIAPVLAAVGQAGFGRVHYVAYGSSDGK